MIVPFAGLIRLRKQSRKFECDRVQVAGGYDVACKRLPRTIRIVIGERVIDGEAVCGKIASTFGRSRHRKRASLEALLLRGFVVCEEKELVMQDWAAN